MDGAEWLDGFVDWQRPDALRMLDFAHAAESVSDSGHLAQTAGSVVAEDWLQTQLHELKHVGPAAVLREVRRLRDRHPQVEDLGKKVAYVEKREARMQYALYQAQGWPIGSGIVESGNKVVMQARLKGPGMHWAPEHVNPLLALRTSACNDCWDEARSQVQVHLYRQKVIQWQERHHHRYDQLLRSVELCVLLWRGRLSKPQPPASPPVSATTKRSGPLRPSATHPWRRRLFAKK